MTATNPIIDEVIASIQDVFGGTPTYSFGENVICVFVEEESSGWEKEELETRKRIWENQVLERSEHIESVTLFFYNKGERKVYDSLYIVTLKEEYTL